MTGISKTHRGARTPKILKTETLLIVKTTLYRPVVEPLEEPKDSEYGDTAHCGTGLHRHVVEPATEPENPGIGDAALYRQLFTALL